MRLHAVTPVVISVLFISAQHAQAQLLGGLLPVLCGCPAGTVCAVVAGCAPCPAGASSPEGSTSCYYCPAVSSRSTSLQYKLRHFLMPTRTHILTKAVYAPCVRPARNRKLARPTVNPVPLARHPSPVDHVPNALPARQVTQTRPHAPPARLEHS